MKSNADLQKDVQDAIKWEPLLNAAEIGVTAKGGIVTLTGVVDSYAKKTEAEDAAKNVAVVNAVVEKIKIDFGMDWTKKNDNEIATEVLASLKLNWEVPNDKIKVTVENGWVTLEGDLEWNFQKESARKSVRNLMGVMGVSNNIKIKSETHDAIEKKEIEKALNRNWAIANQDIHVQVEGTKVTLTGMVASLYQKEEAGKITWNTRGVWTVENDLVVEFNYALID